MIHNIMEEREKLQRRESSLSDPFTEEELMRLIGQVEEQALIRAPGHLKNNVLSQIDAERRRVKRRALFSYRAKVLVGMAAALTVLFLVPVDGVETPQTGILGTLYAGETQDMDPWEQEFLETQRDMEETWKRYRAEQERAAARKQYFRRISEKFRNSKIW